MRIISRKILREFWQKHAEVEEQLKSWYHEAEEGSWKNHNELKGDYPTASILANDRVVFNIKGNKYRLIIKISYKYQMVWIRFIGTHAAYDKIDATKI